VRNLKALEILIMNRKQFDWGMYEPFKPVYEWLKKHITTVSICLCLGFAFGYNASEARVELDCKYAKSIRVGAAAFRCERII
jgi:hypothetical protein